MNNRRKTGQNRFINREPAFDVEDDEGGIQASIPAADASEGGRPRSLLSDSLSTDDDPLRQTISDTAAAVTKQQQQQHLPPPSLRHAAECSTKAPYPAVGSLQRGRRLRRLRDCHDSPFSSFSDRSVSLEDRCSTSSFGGDVTSLGSDSLSCQKTTRLGKHNEDKSLENSTTIGRSKPPIGGHLAANTGQTLRDSCRPPVSIKSFWSLNQEESGEANVRSSAVLQHRPYRSCDISFDRPRSSLKTELTEKADGTRPSPSRPISNVRTVMKIFEQCPQLHPPSPVRFGPCLPRRAASFKETRNRVSSEDVPTSQWKRSLSDKNEDVVLVPGQPQPPRHRSLDDLIRNRPDLGFGGTGEATATKGGRPVINRSVTADIASIINTPRTKSTQSVSSFHQVSLQTPGPKLHFQQPTAAAHSVQQHLAIDDKPIKPPEKLATAAVAMPVKFPKSIGNMIQGLTSKPALRTTSKSEEDLRYRPIVHVLHRIPSPVTLQRSVTLPMPLKKSLPQPSDPMMNSRVSNTLINKQNSVVKDIRAALDTQNLKAQQQVFSTASYMPPLTSRKPSPLPNATSSSGMTQSSPVTKTSTLQLRALAVVSPAASSASKSDVVGRSTVMSVPSMISTPCPVSIPAPSKALHTASTSKSMTDSAVLSVSSVKSRLAPFMSLAAERPLGTKPRTTIVSSSLAPMTSPPGAVASSAFAKIKGVATNEPTITRAPSISSVFRSKTLLTLSTTPLKETDTERKASAENADTTGFDDRDLQRTISHTSCSAVEPLASSAKNSETSPPAAKDLMNYRPKEDVISLQGTTAHPPSFDQSLPRSITSFEKSDPESRCQAPIASHLGGKDQCQAGDSIEAERSQFPTIFEKGLDRLTKAATKYIPNVLPLQHSSLKTVCLHPCNTQPITEITTVPETTVTEVSTSAAIGKDEASKDPEDPVLAATSNESPNNGAKDQKHTTTEDDRNLHKDDTSDFTDSISSNRMLPLPRYSVIKRNRLRQQHRNRCTRHSSSNSSSSSSDEDGPIATECRTSSKKRPRRKCKSSTNRTSETSRP